LRPELTPPPLGDQFTRAPRFSWGLFFGSPNGGGFLAEQDHRA